jgi:NAD(P)-dependent dehydrogenase (short-subunit alcohol dehydrogenase family)
MELTGKVVFITGGARGIGLDAAQRLHAKGGRVVIVDVDGDLARKEAELLGNGALGLAGDVADRTTIDVAVNQAVGTFGRIDVAIANAGIAPPVETVRTGSEAAFDRVLDINLHGVVNTVRATLPQLEANRGYLLVVSSLYAVVNGVLSSPYAMSKCAVEALGRSLRVELAGKGVDVGVAYFGFIDTKLVQDAFDRPGITELRSSFPKFLAEPIPVGRAGAAVADGVEQRAARVIAPGWVRWTLPFRGRWQYLDGRMVRDRKVRRAVDQAESSTMSAARSSGRDKNGE